MKKIIILGAGLLQSFVIKRAKELGYYTICVDMDQKAIGFKYADEYKVINIIDEEACLKYAQECNVDGVLTAATDYGVLTSSYISEKLNLNGLKYEIAKIIKNKYSLRNKLSESNIDQVTQFFEVSSEKDIYKIKDLIVYPVIVKPCDGSGSKGVIKVENESGLVQACFNAMALSLTRKALIETFIIGSEYGVESFVCDGEIFVLGIMKKIMTEPPCYAELSHCIPSGLSIEIEKSIQKVVKNTIKALGINFGAVNIDLLLTDDNKVCIVDIGARMGGNLIGSHIIPYSTGIDYMGNIIHASVGGKVNFTQNENACIATSILALTPGKVKMLPKLQEIMSMEGMIDIILNLKQGDVIRQYRNNLDSCGYVVARGTTRKEAMKQAYETRLLLDSLIERA
jgi:carbamoyl-phosphate synthase large subunit